MPAPDPFPYAEERRLFYVAMTRARKQVRFYTKLGQPSQFLVELERNESLKIQPVDGDPIEPCPECGNGVLQVRQGPHGIFHGCSRFPGCNYKRNPPRETGQALKASRASQRIRQPVKAGDQCPSCRRGVLMQQNGRYGVFLGCSRYREGCLATAKLG
jgi:DNA helicase-4